MTSQRPHSESVSARSASSCLIHSYLGILHVEDMADGKSTVELTVYPYYMAEEIQVCTGQQQG